MPFTYATNPSCDHSRRNRSRQYMSIWLGWHCRHAALGASKSVANPECWVPQTWNAESSNTRDPIEKQGGLSPVGFATSLFASMAQIRFRPPLSRQPAAHWPPKCPYRYRPSSILGVGVGVVDQSISGQTMSPCGLE